MKYLITQWSRCTIYVCKPRMMIGYHPELVEFRIKISLKVVAWKNYLFNFKTKTNINQPAIWHRKWRNWKKSMLSERHGLVVKGTMEIEARTWNSFVVYVYVPKQHADMVNCPYMTQSAYLWTIFIEKILKDI